MPPFPYHIRPIQAEKDAAQIAELIRVGFQPWLDRDNLDYLSRLQHAGEDAAAHPWWMNLTGFPYPLEGIVCTDSGNRILGLINTNTFHLNGKTCSLLSNVCVTPEKRGEGIASHMLEDVIQRQRSAGISGLFLQARMETPSAVNLYRANGFRVTDYRETWIAPSTTPQPKTADNGFTTHRVPEKDAEIFRPAFFRRYPETILWNQNYRADLFSTGLSAEISRFLSGTTNRLFRIQSRDGSVKAWGALQELNGNTDSAWFVPNGRLSEEEETAALICLRSRYKGNKALRLDTPAGVSMNAYINAGFTRQHTLGWMWKEL